MQQPETSRIYECKYPLNSDGRKPNQTIKQRIEGLESECLVTGKWDDE